MCYEDYVKHLLKCLKSFRGSICSACAGPKEMTVAWAYPVIWTEFDLITPKEMDSVLRLMILLPTMLGSIPPDWSRHPER